jgi:hypothetical protein
MFWRSYKKDEDTNKKIPKREEVGDNTTQEEGFKYVAMVDAFATFEHDDGSEYRVNRYYILLENKSGDRRVRVTGSPNSPNSEYSRLCEAEVMAWLHDGPLPKYADKPLKVERKKREKKPPAKIITIDGKEVT